MAFKTFFLICASALIVQCISAQCNNANLAVGSGYILNGCGGLGLGTSGINLGAPGLGLGYSASGGGLTVSSLSPIAPTGLYVVSENVINGPITVSGVLPFLSAVALEGQVASGGSAGTQYGCGNGNIGIISENIVPAGNLGLGVGLGYGPGIGYGAGAGLTAGYGLGAPLTAGLATPCGCGRGIL